MESLRDTSLTDQIQQQLQQLSSNRNSEVLIDAFFLGFLFRNERNLQLNEAIELINTLTQFKEIQLAKQGDKQFIYSLLMKRAKAQAQQSGAISMMVQLQKEIEYLMNPESPQRVDDQQNQSLELIRQLQEQERVELEKELQRKDEDNKLSQRLADQLLQEEERKAEDVREKNYERDYGNVQCGICLEGLLDEDFWGLECCHVLHKKCLAEYFKTQIQARKFPIKCPTEKCFQDVLYQDLVEIIDGELLENFHDYTFNQFVDFHQQEVSWCPTPNCKYVFVLDANEPEFHCPLCNKHYCLRCRIEFHHGQTCKEYQISNNWGKDDQAFDSFVRGHKFKQCPKCKFWVEKNEGCDHMTCRCGEQFCYKCGGKYGACDCMKRPEPIVRPVAVVQRHPPRPAVHKNGKHKVRHSHAIQTIQTKISQPQAISEEVAVEDLVEEDENANQSANHVWNLLPSFFRKNSNQANNRLPPKK